MKQGPTEQQMTDSRPVIQFNSIQLNAIQSDR